MKKIINAVENIVDEMCAGIVAAHPELKLLPKYRVIRRALLNPEKVTLISGGGSGHEPAHAGFVGAGMLDAAVCGDVFASPSTMQVYNAILATQSKKGTLLIVKNYSGDRMNFDAAAEMAQDDDVVVDSVYVNDDAAVEDSLYTVGRRGVAGTLFVHKIAGAAAESGMEMEQVKEIAQRVVQNCRTLGFALTSCTVPAKGTPTFVLGEQELEYGVGIHGEPGIERQEIRPADALAESILLKLITELDLKKGDRTALIMNGFGATPMMELYVLNHSVRKMLDDRGIQVHKTLVGNYMTSIDMAGASITLLKLDAELTALLDSPCGAPAWQ
jgi:dihydroxyacetone kinase